MNVEHLWNDNDGEKTDVLGENPLPSPIFYHNFHKFTDLRSNTCFPRERPATNLMSHGTPKILQNIPDTSNI
jgi:hypothetical protein